MNDYRDLLRSLGEIGRAHASLADSLDSVDLSVPETRQRLEVLRVTYRLIDRLGKDDPERLNRLIKELFPRQ